jgi:hypothetical protein
MLPCTFLFRLLAGFLLAVYRQIKNVLYKSRVIGFINDLNFLAYLILETNVIYKLYDLHILEFLRAGRPGFDFWKGQGIFLYSIAFKPNLGATQLLVPSLRIVELYFHYPTNRKVTGSNPDEVIGFLSIYLILPAALWRWVDSASNRNYYSE